MSNSQPWRCLLCRLQPAKPLRAGRRKFHSSFPTQARTRGHPAYPNIKAADMGLIEETAKHAVSKIKPYTSREKKLLALKYTPEQMAAIEAGEKAIDPKDLLLQGRRRTDPGRMNYLDDFSKLLPVVDKPVDSPGGDIGSRARSATQEELFATFRLMQDDSTDGIVDESLLFNPKTTPEMKVEMLRKISEAKESPDFSAAFAKLISGKGKKPNQQDTLALKLLKTTNSDTTRPDEDEDPHMVRLCQQTGMTKDDIRKIRVKNLVQHRVVNQTRMGKIQSLYYLTIAGNQNGVLGIGEGKAAEDEDGRRQAMMAAIRNMKPIPRYEERTIFGEVEGKVGASIVKLSARPPGFGNRCQHLIYELARAAGIQDLAARTPRSRNPMNVVKAAWQALMSQRLPEDIARSRGRKLVDVRKVYYGGQVY